METNSMINFLNIRNHFPEYHENKSWWAYRYCKDVKDKPEIRKHVTDSFDAYNYCKNVKDRPEIRKYITDSEGAYWYCKNVKDRSEIRMHITENYYLVRYRKWKAKQ